MISIAARPFDPAGTLLIPRPGPNSDLRSGSRRMTRTATLDGGVAVSDTGSTDADRVLRISVLQASPGQIAAAARLVTLYPIVTIMLADGAFEGVPERYTMSGGNLTLNISLTKRISQ